MKITLDTDVITASDVSGLLALLATVSPDALQAALADMTTTVGEVSQTEFAPLAAEAFGAGMSPPAADPNDPVALYQQMGGTLPPAAPPAPASSLEAGTLPAAAVPPAPPPASPTSATPAPAASPAPTASSPPTLDAQGVPWDARIHSTPATLTKQNVWRAKRGVSDALVAQVQAELLAARGPVPTPPAAPSVPAAPPPSVPATPAPAAAPAPSAPVPAAPPPADAPPAAPPAAAGPTFQDFMNWASAAQAAGKITIAQLNEAAALNGLERVGQLMDRPDLVPATLATAKMLAGEA